MFKSVRTDLISRTIMEQIKSAIFQKKIKPGEKLPSERQLMEQFQRSRVTVREVQRALEDRELPVRELRKPLQRKR
jgi:GntR family transcriptional regulator, transcriptional repressor for pyruvate dehydrogenase complex